MCVRKISTAAGAGLTQSNAGAAGLSVLRSAPTPIIIPCHLPNVFAKAQFDQNANLAQ